MCHLYNHLNSEKKDLQVLHQIIFTPTTVYFLETIWINISVSFPQGAHRLCLSTLLFFHTTLYHYFDLYTETMLFLPLKLYMRMNSYKFVINYPILIRWTPTVALFGRVYGKGKFGSYPTTHTNPIQWNNRKSLKVSGFLRWPQSHLFNK